MIIENGDVFIQCILNFPGGGLHIFAWTSHHNTHVFSPHAPGRPAAVHGCITTAQDQNSFADLLYMTKNHRGKPLYAHMDLCIALPPTGQIKISSPRGPGAGKDSIIALGEHGL